MDKSSPTYKRELRLLRIHGISAERHHQIWERQGGVCPICLRPLPVEFLTRVELREVEVRPHVDHDHETDEVRGLLCGACNQALGLFHDDPETIARAIEYLASAPRITPQRRIGVANELKTHCPSGHEYTPENTYIDPKHGNRKCRACSSSRERVRDRKHPCLDCGKPVSAQSVRCHSCGAKASWANR